MTDEEILSSISRGGRVAEAAVKALYARYGQHMLRYFVYQGVSGEEAKDVLQETVIKIIRNAHSFEHRGAARAWIWQIARNCLTDAFNKRSRQMEEVQQDDEAWRGTIENTPSPPGRSDLEVQDCVNRSLEVFAVKAPERALALVLFVEGMSMEEIGHRIGRTTAATKEFLCQCRKKVREYMVHCTELLEAS